MNLLGTVLGLHNPALVALACLLMALGLYLSVAMLRRARSATGFAVYHWGLMSSTMSSGAIWAGEFILLTSFFGSLGWAFDPFLSFLSAMLLILGTSTGRVLMLKSRSAAGRFGGYVLAGLSVTGAQALSLEAFAWFSHSTLAIGSVIGLVCCLYLAGVHVLLPSLRKRGVARDAQMAALILATVLVGHVALLMTIPEAITTNLQSGASNGAVAVLFPVAAISLVLSMVGASTFLVDAHQHREAVEKYRRMAFHDSLTGLANRLNMQVTLDEFVVRHAEDGVQMAVAVLDLDRFKDVNDVHGHAAGDALLKGLAQHLTENMHGNEMLTRLGGDEFVGVKFGAKNREEALDFAQRLCDLTKSFDAWMTGDIKVGASIGVSLFPADGDLTEHLLSRADLAMYRAKALGRNQVCMFDPEMDELSRKKSALSIDLSRAIEDEELQMRFQPQVNAQSGELTGFEVLLRWEHPELGIVSPEEFIPLAEQTGQILDIGEWVLRNACAEAATWKRPYRIAVNVAAAQLSRWTLAEIVRDTLEQSGLQPTRLELEITESGIINDLDNAYRSMQRINRMGVAIAMDDFGTGYSSLSTLQSFPFDKIKIDKAFISDVTANSNSAAIVKATVTLANEMGIKVLAEGVETQEQLEFLREVNCGEIQGYYFSRPLTIEDARKTYDLMASTEDLFDADSRAEQSATPDRKGVA